MSIPVLLPQDAYVCCGYKSPCFYLYIPELICLFSVMGWNNAHKCHFRVIYVFRFSGYSQEISLKILPYLQWKEKKICSLSYHEKYAINLRNSYSLNLCWFISGSVSHYHPHLQEQLGCSFNKDYIYFLQSTGILCVSNASQSLLEISVPVCK